MSIRSGHTGLLAAAGLLVVVASGCAVSDQLDLPDAAISGSGGTGSTASGAGGSDQGSGGDVGAGGSPATGEGGVTGTGGIVGTGGSGTGGNGTGGNGTGGNGTGGNGTGGATGTGGIKGTGGSTGTGGVKGTGGSTGTGGSNGTGGSTGTGGAGGSAAPTFTQVYTTILVPFCSGSSCHNPGSQKGVSFASQSSAYTAVKSRVTVGNGTGSSFYKTISSGSMPPGGTKISAANLALLAAWINAGALNN
jgi:hypothetical protein